MAQCLALSEGDQASENWIGSGSWNGRKATPGLIIAETNFVIIKTPKLNAIICISVSRPTSQRRSIIGAERRRRIPRYRLCFMRHRLSGLKRSTTE